MTKKKTRWSSSDGNTQSSSKAQILAQITHLEAVKAELEKDLQCHVVSDDFVISAAAISGIHLGNFQLDISGDVKTYSAACNELGFFMTVVVKDNSIAKIELLLNEYSPLAEVRGPLLGMAEELCPNRVLMVIQQCKQMINSRNKILHSLTPKYYYLWSSKDYESGQLDVEVCNMWVYSDSLNDKDLPLKIELQWRFSWNTAYQSLVHQFIIKEATWDVLPVNTFVQSLTTNVHHFSEEENLMQIWCQLNDWITNMDQTDHNITCQ